jgi:hypothetical protein
MWVVEEALDLLDRQVNMYGMIDWSIPFGMPPPSPVILFSLAEPPALIFASLRSLRMRACSAALDGGELATSDDEDGTGVVSAMFRYIAEAELLCKVFLVRRQPAKCPPISMSEVEAIVAREG